MDNNFRLASRLLNNFQSDETKQIYIILHINNNHWTVAKIDMESKKVYYDCGIIVLNYIEQEIGISNQSWSMQQSDYFRIRYLCVTLNCNSEEFSFPQDSISINSFEILWNQLVEKYFNNDANNYLSQNLYIIGNKQGCCWKKQIITAGVKTTLCLEGNYVRTHEKPKPFVETFGEAFDKFRKIANFANEDKKKYQLLDNALEEAI
ncbi:12043_t:CDS:2 [Entrophospora sp. SA101]|nr:12043_t:CDS:2 [Entrophospora sp. SA101]